MFYSLSFPAFKKLWLGCTYLHYPSPSDLHLVLVANSEFELNLGEPAAQSSWILNENGIEKQAIDK